ncbi:MAG: response regulator [Treponema sp.]|jgi:CheY-like chemotaxis protein/HPt (histidine-containing phosphotransfer) domain-containing protein|nr:response regulator [Treponema sp.]
MNDDKKNTVETVQKKKQALKHIDLYYGKVLVVDDMPLNLHIMQLLLKPYELQVDTAEDGYKAVEMIEGGNLYDIVFMDHMMPGLDGVETATKMRELGYTLPIVVLSANNDIEQSKRFMAVGFDAFITKPINARQLNSILEKFAEDRPSQDFNDATYRQKRTEHEYGEETAFLNLHPQLAEIFVQDLTKFIKVLEEIYGKRGAYGDEDIRLYTISVHAVKTALANMGKKELSAIAHKLEQAGRATDTAVITEGTPAFLEELRVIIKEHNSQKKSGGDDKLEDSSVGHEDRGGHFSSPYLREKLLAVKNACEEYDRKTAKDTIVELRQKKWPNSIEESLSSMAEQLLNGDFVEVSKIAEKIMR